MIPIFLKAKHWQLFLALCGPMFLLSFYIIYDSFILFNDQKTPFDSDLNILFEIFPILMIIGMGIFFGWFWSMAIGLQQCIPADIKMKVTRFKIFFFIPLIYISFFMLYINEIPIGSPESIKWVFALMIPLHLFSMFCMFYMMYFVSKTIKTAELQKEVTFSEFLGEFFLLWFYLIGIWVIQPKVNRLYAKIHSNNKPK